MASPDRASRTPAELDLEHEELIDSLVEVAASMPGDAHQQMDALGEYMGAAQVRIFVAYGDWQIAAARLAGEPEPAFEGIERNDRCSMYADGTWAAARRRCREMRVSARAEWRAYSAHVACRGRVRARPRGAGRPRALARARASSRGGDPGGPGLDDLPPRPAASPLGAAA
jgi:hypothetical protein